MTTSIDPSWQNKQNWINALNAAEAQLEEAAKELDDIIANRYNSAADEYGQAHAARKKLQGLLCDMRVAYHRGDNYLVWKLSYV